MLGDRRGGVGTSFCPLSSTLPACLRRSFMHVNSSTRFFSHVHARFQLATAAQVVSKVFAVAAKPCSCTSSWGGGGETSRTLVVVDRVPKGGFTSRPSRQVLDHSLHAHRVEEVCIDKKEPRGASWQSRTPANGSIWTSSIGPEVIGDGRHHSPDWPKLYKRARLQIHNSS